MTTVDFIVIILNVSLYNITCNDNGKFTYDFRC